MLAVAAAVAELVEVLEEAEQAAPVEVRSAADSPVGVSTAALAVSLVVIAVAEAGEVAVPGFAEVLTGDAALAQLGFAHWDFAFWKQASFALGGRADRIVLAGRAGLGCSAVNSRVALQGDVAVPVAAPVVGPAVAAAAAAAVVAAVGLELAAVAAAAVVAVA